MHPPRLFARTVLQRSAYLSIPFGTIRSPKLRLQTRPFTPTPPPSMRLPYAPSTPPASAPASTQEIYTRIAARRHPRPLIPLDLALLHNPAIADGWNTLLGAIRTKTTLDPGVTELAVCRIAVLNGAAWEWIAHAPLAIKGGVTREALVAVLESPVLVQGGQRKGGEEGEGEGALSAMQWAVLAYTDAMTKEVKVEDGVFDALRKWFDEREVVELTATIAAYNCVSRFLVALDVGENNGKEMVVP